MFRTASTRGVAALCVALTIAACELAVSLDGLTTPTGDAGVADARTDPVATDGDADAAAIARCDPSKAFGPLTLVPGVNTAADERWGRLSDDELEICFQAQGSSGRTQVFLARRASRLDPFGARVASAINAAGTDNFDPALGSDGNTLAFSSERAGGAGLRDIFFAVRASRAADFGAPAPIVPVNSYGDEAMPYLTPANAALWFGSDRSKAGINDIYVARGQNMKFGAPVPVVELNSTSDDQFAVPSADEMYVYFASDRLPDGGPANFDIWTARRPSAGAPFGGLARVPELNSADDDFPTWLSPDGCRLYVTSTRAGNGDIYVAERAP